MLHQEESRLTVSPASASFSVCPEATVTRIPGAKGAVGLPEAPRLSGSLLARVCPNRTTAPARSRRLRTSPLPKPAPSGHCAPDGSHTHADRGPQPRTGMQSPTSPFPLPPSSGLRSPPAPAAQSPPARPSGPGARRHPRASGNCRESQPARPRTRRRRQLAGGPGGGCPRPVRAQRPLRPRLAKAAEGGREPPALLPPSLPRARPPPSPPPSHPPAAGGVRASAPAPISSARRRRWRRRLVRAVIYLFPGPERL